MVNNKIFVYGSLMRGKSNSALLRGSTFLGTASAEGLRLYRVTDPYLGAVRGEGRRVRGELFKVDPSRWEELDRLEGNDYYYRRELTEVILDDTGEKTRAWVYLWLQDVDPRMEVPYELQPWS